MANYDELQEVIEAYGEEGSQSLDQYLRDAAKHFKELALTHTKDARTLGVRRDSLENEGLIYEARNYRSLARKAESLIGRFT